MTEKKITEYVEAALPYVQYALLAAVLAFVAFGIGQEFRRMMGWE